SLTATVLTLDTSGELAAEAAVSNVEVTGVETKAAYAAAWRAEFDAFASHRGRIATSAGACRIPSELHSRRWLFRREVSWAAASRFGEFNPANSLGRVKNGALRDITIRDADGNLDEWDSRLDRGLSSTDGSNGRAITLQS